MIQSRRTAPPPLPRSTGKSSWWITVLAAVTTLILGVAISEVRPRSESKQEKQLAIDFSQAKSQIQSLKSEISRFQLSQNNLRQELENAQKLIRDLKMDREKLAARVEKNEPQWDLMDYDTVPLKVGDQAILYLGPGERGTKIPVGNEKSRLEVHTAYTFSDEATLKKWRNIGAVFTVADGDRFQVVENAEAFFGVKRLGVKQNADEPLLWIGKEYLFDLKIRDLLVERDKQRKSHIYDTKTGKWKDD